MQKLSIKNIIDFRSKKSDSSKRNFINKIKVGKQKSEESDGGGDYWIISLSSISNAFKNNNLQCIKDKILEIEEKISKNEKKNTKVMYRRNADILYSYEDINLKQWQPSNIKTILPKHKAESILKIQDLPVQALPHHVFLFEKKGVKEVGAIWFVAKLDGYTKDELGMFADILFRYLKANFSNDYIVSSEYCLAVDVIGQNHVSYSQIEQSKVRAILDLTIGEIKKMM